MNQRLVALTLTACDATPQPASALASPPAPAAAAPAPPPAVGAQELPSRPIAIARIRCEALLSTAEDDPGAASLF